MKRRLKIIPQLQVPQQYELWESQGAHRGQVVLQFDRNNHSQVQFELFGDQQQQHSSRKWIMVNSNGDIMVNEPWDYDQLAIIFAYYTIVKCNSKKNNKNNDDDDDGLAATAPDLPEVALKSPTKSPTKTGTPATDYTSILSKTKTTATTKKSHRGGLFERIFHKTPKKSQTNEDGDVQLKAFVTDETEQEGFLEGIKNKLTKVCFHKSIGCFYSRDFNESERILPILPQSPDIIKPVFHMYTPNSKIIGETLKWNATIDQLRATKFDESLRTAFIVHGYQSGYAMWMENMRDYILYKSNDTYNVVVVVWEDGARTPIYNLAATNTRVVGACIGSFINRLSTAFNTSNDRIWLIGHSLGAHTCGYAGKRLKDPKLWRITALDPAGVAFQFNNSVMRLDHNDAQIVDVIHTDAALSYVEGFGIHDTLGHYDFYPNGGSWQPGCPISHSIARKFTSTVFGGDITCSHSRACLLMVDLDKPEDTCKAIGYQCESYNTFLEGRCANCAQSRCKPMGIDPDYWLDDKPDPSALNKKYFLTTGRYIDYCLYHYQIALDISDKSDLVSGLLNITLKVTIDNQSISSSSTSS
ncbi:pancreatic lipase-related protein 2-like, partial [Oppia nitens]|uniref:pancreatic lipase-related protein 2-like n=1 Tax=Oppia nitens TaxID=1686743 RepID=UPI0023D9CCE2